MKFKKLLIIISCSIMLALTWSCDNFKSPFSYNQPIFIDGNYTHYFQPLTALQKGDRVYVINIEGLDNVQQLPIISLQGVVAKTKPQIFVIPSVDYYTWLTDLAQWYSIEVDETYLQDPDGLINHFKNHLKNNRAIICDSNTVNLAMSVAGVTLGLVFDRSEEERAYAFGLVKYKDVRDRSMDWLLENYGSEFQTSGALFQPNSLLGCRDLAIAQNLIQFYDKTGPQLPSILTGQQEITMLGYMNDKKRAEWISYFNQHNAFFVETSTASNLSLLSAARPPGIRQHTHVRQIADSSYHYVCFITTGGDKIDFQLSDFVCSVNSFSSPVRGKINLGWTISPLLLELAPTVLKYFYDRASYGDILDVFVACPSGAGYLFPTQYSNLTTHTQRLNHLLAAADLNVLALQDNNRSEFVPEFFDVYTRMSGIKGILFFDYQTLDYFNGRILISNNKPIVSCRYAITEGCSEEQIYESLSDLSPEIHSENGYSLIAIDSGKKSIQSAEEIANNLDSTRFKIVAPEVFIQIITENVKQVQ